MLNASIVGPDSGVPSCFDNISVLNPTSARASVARRKVLPRWYGDLTLKSTAKLKDDVGAQRGGSVLMDSGQRGILERSGQRTFQLAFRAGDLSEGRKCMRDGVDMRLVV